MYKMHIVTNKTDEDQFLTDIGSMSIGYTTMNVHELQIVEDPIDDSCSCWEVIF